MMLIMMIVIMISFRFDNFVEHITKFTIIHLTAVRQCITGLSSSNEGKENPTKLGVYLIRTRPFFVPSNKMKYKHRIAMVILYFVMTSCIDLSKSIY